MNLVEDSATEWHTFGQRRVFKTRHFQRWMRSTELTDEALCRAVREMAAGLLDADLGNGVVKKRVALPGRGKSGGVRTLVATRKASVWFFMAGFAKNDRANVTPSELEALQTLAGSLLGLAPRRLDALVQDGSLQEICHDDSTQDAP